MVSVFSCTLQFMQNSGQVYTDVKKQHKQKKKSDDGLVNKPTLLDVKFE